MTHQLPRRHFEFGTAETASEFRYVPAKTRNKRWATVFEGRNTGTVIAVQQKIATLACYEAFDTLRAQEGIDSPEMQQLADVMSVAALGTAHHTFGSPNQNTLNRRNILLPRMLDPETERRMTSKDMADKVASGLNHAARIGELVEIMVNAAEDTRRTDERLGRILATVGSDLAVMKDEVTRLREDEAGMQYAAWASARRAATRSLELTGAIGARPTMAQLPDSQSPLRRYMHDNTAMISTEVHGIFVDILDQTSADELLAQEARLDQTLF